MEKWYSFFKKKGTIDSENVFIQIVKAGDKLENESFRIENGKVIDLKTEEFSEEKYNTMLSSDFSHLPFFISIIMQALIVACLSNPEHQEEMLWV